MSDLSFLTNEGIAGVYTICEEIYHTGLDQTKPYSQQVIKDPDIRRAIDEFEAKANRNEYVLAGWIDQAVLEIKATDQTFLACAALTDEYRPDQGGDSGIYLISQDGNEVLEIGMSKEIGRLWVSTYMKS